MSGGLLAMIKAWMIWLGCLALVVGCEEGLPVMPELSPEGDEAAEVETGLVGPTEPAAVEAGAISIDEQTYLLPPAVLVVEAIDAGLRVQLTGSEQADDQTGNTLLLDMQVAATTLPSLREHPWVFRTSEDAWTDTPQGLAIEEHGWVLRPYSVTVEFVPDEDDLAVVTIRISGVFILFDLADPPDAPGRRVEVSGQFPAGVMVRVAGK